MTNETMKQHFALCDQLDDVLSQKDKLRKKIKSLDEREKMIRSEIFFGMTGKRFGETFTWNDKIYEILSENSIWITTGSLRTFYAPHLDAFLLGRAKSPIKG